MDSSDAIAILLAARHDPELCKLADHQKAQSMVESNEALRARFEAERVYYDQHDDLLAQVRLPDHVRSAIRSKLREAQAGQGNVLFWPKRALAFAAAAALLIMVGGLLVTQHRSSPEVAARTPATLDELRVFAATQVAAGPLELDRFSDQPQELIAWLQGSGAPVAKTPPGVLHGMPSMGCKVYDWNGGQVALICFRTPSDEVVHLFIAERHGMKVESTPGQSGLRIVQHRETQSWFDGHNAYVLVAHEEGQRLTGFSS